jgi:hypothetical protein
MRYYQAIKWFCVLIFFEISAVPYNFSICALFKNESACLKEWIEYHRLIGVDHFYLYNNFSADNYKAVLRPYIKQNLVTLIEWPNLIPENSDCLWSLSTQLTAYENALKWSAKAKTKWLVFLDVNEFLVSPRGEKISDILYQHEDSPGIILSVEYYDASYRNFPLHRLVIEASSITAPPKQNIFRAVSKTILKPDLCTNFLWPPYKCVFKEDAKPVRISKHILRIQQYENRMRFPSIQEIKKTVPIDVTYMPEEMISSYLANGYELEDRTIYPYIPSLYQRMGLGPSAIAPHRAVFYK